MAPTCPVCNEESVACIDQQTARSIYTPEFYGHSYRGRVYWHWMEWIEDWEGAVIYE